MFNFTAAQRTTTLTRYFSPRRKAASYSSPTVPSQKQLTQHAIPHPDDPPRSDNPYDETGEPPQARPPKQTALSAGGCGISIFISMRWNRNKAQRLWNAERRSHLDKLPDRWVWEVYNSVSMASGRAVPQSQNGLTVS
ncbi:hypothetical protein CNYM01_09219 [Colletotrichum nymphaeae SA-01]|uniref:Uncharacterized protein n=1 Tax=Colletotrichum nymphaeae SA-01 TaxID=1460502 RepID=A0A135TJ23_9PEZI|nr:hypothetical protein CNYM01_09219 [Colletotrichum nymphaeae SA-01]